MTKIRLLMAAALLCGSFLSAWQWRSTIAEKDIVNIRIKYEKASAAATRIEKDLLESQREVSDLQDKISQDRLKIENAKAKVITKEVIKYVKNNNATCTLSNDWVRLHDSAAKGSMPKTSDTTSPIDGSPRRITDIDVIETVADNYKSCREYSIKLKSLQDWVNALISQENK